jgi:hypothetical protein
VLQFVLENSFYLSKQKYSSNVVEKCFGRCNKYGIQLLINTLIQPDTVKELLFDTFGNFILQKMIEYSQADVQNYLLSIIVPLLEQLKNYHFGHRLYTKLIITYPELSSMIMYHTLSKK